MYKLAKIKKAPRLYLEDNLHFGFKASTKAFLLISKSNLPDKENLANQFRIECDNFTKVGTEISKIVSGSESVLTKKWLYRRNNFENAYKMRSKIYNNTLHCY